MEGHLSDALCRMAELGVVIGGTVAKSDLDGFYCRSEWT